MSLAEITWERRRLVREARERLGGDDRFVDFGVRLHVIRGASGGIVANPAWPPVERVRTHEFGGIWDRRRRRWDGAESERPQIWFCSEDQERHVLPGVGKPKRLVSGGFGAGKTEALSMWAWLQDIELAEYARHVPTGVILGTAPVEHRLRVLKSKLLARSAPSWCTWHERYHTLHVATGLDIMLRATKRQSGDMGSPLAGIDALACFSDEIQDSIFDPEVEGEIEGRGRVARDGVYPRFCTATAKRSSKWRTYRGSRPGTEWELDRLPTTRSPFVHASYIRSLRLGKSKAQFDREVLGLDVAPEKQIYHTFRRELHLRRRPEVGARDVTSKLLRHFGIPNGQILLGHDPGSLKDVSGMLKAYTFAREVELDGAKIPAGVPVWWVIGEVTTEKTTAEAHATKLRDRLQDQYHVMLGYEDDPDVLVLADPSSENEAKKAPHKSVYKAFARCGFRIASGASHGKRVPKEAGIEMVVGLFRDVDGYARLFVDVDEHGRPVAPGIVKACEEAERNDAGEAETERKDAYDLSHWMAQLRYALWRLEREGGIVRRVYEEQFRRLAS